MRGATACRLRQLVSDPVAFGLARLAEEETRSRAAFEDAPGRWYAAGEDILIRATDPFWDGVCVANAHAPADAHIVDHDPQRELRDIENKRAILAGHLDIESIYGLVCKVCVSWQDAPWGDGETEFGIAIPDPWPCPPIRRVIARWDDHPDFEQEWAVA